MDDKLESKIERIDDRLSAKLLAAEPDEPTEPRPLSIIESSSDPHSQVMQDYLDFYNNQLFRILVEMFNFKQRYQYQISEIKLILVPIKEEGHDYKLDVVAFAKDPKSKDKQLFSVEIESTLDSFAKEFTKILATIMRYGLKDIFLKAKDINEDAYL